MGYFLGLIVDSAEIAPFNLAVRGKGTVHHYYFSSLVIF